MNRSIKKEFILILWWILYAILVASSLGKNNTLTGVLIIGGSAGVLFCWFSLKNLILFLTAGLGGFAGEYLLTISGYWIYNNPSTVPFSKNLVITTLPWWLFFAWGCIILVFIQLAYLIRKTISFSTILKSNLIRKISIISLWLVMGIYLSIVYIKLNFSLTRWFLFLIVPIIIFWHTSVDIISFFIGAILGTMIEWICIKSGIWSYTHPYFHRIGIPLSLPLAWGLATVFLRRFSLLFEKRKVVTPRP